MCNVARSIILKHLINGSLVVSAISLNLLPVVVKNHLNKQGLLMINIAALSASVACLNLLDTKKDMVELKNAKAPKVKVKSEILTAVLPDLKPEVKPEIEFNWLKKALTVSVFLAGKKRSGKTFLMKWLLARFVESSSKNDLFFISDPHYDDIDFADCWLNSDTDKLLIENKRLVKSSGDTLEMVQKISALISVRKAKGELVKKGAGRVRIFLDEIDSWEGKTQAAIIDLVQVIEFEAAKYGFTCVVGAHSTKKHTTGIDSSVLSSMLNILFLSIIFDKGSVLPGYFPVVKELKKMVDSYKIREKNQPRIVVIGDEHEVTISHVPDLIKTKFEVSDE